MRTNEEKRIGIYGENRPTRHADSRTAPFPPVDGVFTSPPDVGLIDYHKQHAYAYHLLGLQDLREGEMGAASNGSSERAKAQYVQDIVTVFRNALQAMPHGERLIVVANEKYGLYPTIQVGVNQEAVLPATSTDARAGDAANSSRSVFIWKKPGYRLFLSRHMNA